MNGGFGEITPWRAFVAVAVLAGILAITLRSVGARRRLALAIGKWVAAAAGLVLGQAGLALVGEPELATVRPLGGLLLAWVGLIVGLQLSRQAVARMPAVLLRWSALDLLLSAAIAAVTGWVLWNRLDTSPWTASVAMAMTLMGTACLGWSPETRSLELGRGRPAETTAMLIRAGSGLQAALATLIFGIGASVTDFGPDGTLKFELQGGIAVTATATAIGVTVAIGVSLMVDRLARRAGERMVITLGAIAILAGTADWLHTTPLFSGLVCGAVLANLGGEGLRRLGSRLRDAELTLAVAIFLLAGLLLGPVDGTVLGALVVFALAVRLVGKPAVSALAGLPGPPPWQAIRTMARRPAPIGVAIVVGGVLLRDSQVRRTALAATLIVGFVMFLLHLVRPAFRTGRSAA